MQLAPDIPMATHVGVATLRVADLEDTSGMATPQKVRLLLQSPSVTPELSQNGSALPRLTAVHLVVDCFVESRASAESNLRAALNCGNSADARSIGPATSCGKNDTKAA